jgi:hypothetical protein
VVAKFKESSVRSEWLALFDLFYPLEMWMYRALKAHPGGS